MKALLLVAHGSRMASSNDEIHALAAQLRDADQDFAHAFDLVEHAFLEMAEPNIAQGGEKLIAGGARDIVVLPCFLAAGQHVAADIPAEVARLEARHPRVSITIAPHLGGATGMRALIETHLRKTAATHHRQSAHPCDPKT